MSVACAGREAGLNFGCVVREFLPGLLAACPQLSRRKQRLLERMALCRTGALGASVWQCSHCGQAVSVPLGCGDRHCPSCQAGRSRQWLEAQMRTLLPTPCFHVVFTLPQELQALARSNQAALYRLLFEAASESLLEFSQQLNYHPHLHCIITAGALSEDGQTWRRPKSSRYLFPEAALSALFRGKFMAGLRQQQARLRWPEGMDFGGMRRLYDQHWRVYLKRPFGGPEQVLAYLANYTHRVAISNRRLEKIDPAAGTVRFGYRDYADGQRIKSQEISGVEFLRRFCQHLLPRHFTRIRHYGILGNNRKRRDIAQARLLLLSRRTLSLLLRLHRPPAEQAWPCPHCCSGRMHTIRVDVRRSFHRARPP